MLRCISTSDSWISDPSGWRIPLKSGGRINGIIVTTQKDEVKIKQLKLDDELKENIFALAIELKPIGHEENWKKKIQEKIQEFSQKG